MLEKEKDCTISRRRRPNLAEKLYLCTVKRKNDTTKIMSIDTYRLTSMEEPSDEVLSQLMREAAEDAARKREEATAHFFSQLKSDAQKIEAAW